MAGVAWAGQLTYKGYNVVQVLVNGKALGGDVPAINVDGHVMMPVRAISEALGGKVDWDGATQSVLVDTASAAAATVNGKVISMADLNARLQEQSGQQMLNRMIEEELIRQEAAKLNLSVTDVELAAEIQRVRDQVGGAQQLAEALRQNNLTQAQFEQLTEFNLLARKVVATVVAPQITDDAVQKHYQANQLRLRYANTQVRASHILVATEAEAKQVLERLAKGEKFADLAMALSTDPSAKSNKGDLGFFGPGVMVAEFEQAAFALKVGAPSAPVKTAYGWHIIEVTDRTEGAAISEAEALTAARQELVDQKTRDTISPWLQELKAKAKIQNHFGAAK